MATPRICSILGCDKPHYGRGWCSKHYSRWLRHGDPITCLTTLGEPRRFLHEIAIPFNGDDCLIWPYSQTGGGYGQIWLNGRMTMVNRLICHAAYGEPPTREHQAAHSCGNGHLGCCNPVHLRWASPKENQEDRIVHGTYTRGEHHPSAKLTEADVRKIKSLKGRLTLHAIADQFGVSFQTISRIHRETAWEWLE